VFQETPQLSDSGLRLSVAASRVLLEEPVQVHNSSGGLWSSAGGRLEMTTGPRETAVRAVVASTE